MKVDDTELLGQRIGLCEKIAGSRAALAERTGISARTLENYSHGRNDPKASACVAIAHATDVSIEWLLTGQGAPGLFYKNCWSGQSPSPCRRGQSW